MPSEKSYLSVSNLKISSDLFDFVNSEVIPGTFVDRENFWEGFSKLIHELSPENKSLLKKRVDLQKKIDSWHINTKYKPYNQSDYIKFLRDIGYLVTEGPNFNIQTENVDEELSKISGPQLVVPLINARYSINAANARWGSLYDALYGTDSIPRDSKSDKKEYDPERGKKVIKWSKEFLDESIPLIDGSHQDATSYKINDQRVYITLSNGKKVALKNEQKLIGYTGSASFPESILFRNNGLHIQITFNKDHSVGKDDKANISDIILESAISTIMDCEDSIAAVDSEDKITVYRNWLGLMKGDLKTSFQKNGRNIQRCLNKDLIFQGTCGSEITIPGRSTLLIRNVGHLMTTNTILQDDGSESPEGIVDAVITSLIAKHDLLQNSLVKNSKTGSIYIVKPKMHGPDEVRFTDKIFQYVEKLISLPRNTLKMGIMDEERRTSINLKECIRAAKNRVVFINTGFLDRTGDEIHTSMEAGPIIKKGNIKKCVWIKAYEDRNVDIGLSCGLKGKAQIGKGMWAMPDMMAEMLKSKIEHPKSGATTAWVPSPTAATLHATHYHRVNVEEYQDVISSRKHAKIEDLLTIPLAEGTNWSSDEVQRELENNIQGILGYVVRWIDQGVGCSKVLDINNLGLMEDRATLRISSQHIANWLRHEVCSENQVIETLERMAKVVDNQNSNDPEYQLMSRDLKNNIAFNAASDLIFEGAKQTNGYTEPILHKYRRYKKNNDSIN
tara:strand:+ start:73321 stop:75507 length:2187 start_codon:yes stop_codon:yes gene_type:complete